MERTQHSNGMINKRTKKHLLKAAKRHFKEGRLLTITYDKLMDTGEIATTHRYYKTFKQDIKRVLKLEMSGTIKLEESKTELIKQMDRTIKALRDDGNNLVGEDNLWSSYADTLYHLLMQLHNYL